jgi:hypothetical protein
MPKRVLELQQFGSMWQASLDGQTLVCATSRAGVIGGAGGLLRCLLKDPEFVANLQCYGLDVEEMLPAKPSMANPHPAPTIDFATAKQLVAEQWLPIAEQRVGTVVRIVDEDCIEFEWGWVIYWQPVEPNKGDPRFVNEYHFPFLADRVTGDTGLSGGTKGLQHGIIELLQWRPTELCGPYPPGKQDWLIVYDAFEAAGAFTPTGRPSS